MANTILTPQIITNELLRRFQNNLGFAKVVHHEDYSEHFAKPGAKIGDTLSLREPVRLVAWGSSRGRQAGSRARYSPSVARAASSP